MNPLHKRKIGKECSQGRGKLPNYFRNKTAQLIAGFGLSLLLSTPATEAATVRFDPTSLTVKPGDLFSMKIVGEDFTSTLDGGGLNLSFDPAVLKVNSVALDTGVWEFFTRIGPIDNAVGTVSALVFSSFEERSKNFDIGTVFFTAKGPGTSNLMLTAYAGNPFTSGGAPLPVALTSGAVTVVPLPAALWLLLSGMGTLLLTLKTRMAS